MWRSILRTSNVVIRNSWRTFLTDAYKCSESWNTRLSSPVLSKINLDSYYYELDQKMQQLGKISAVDVDIYVNKVTDDNHPDEMSDLVHKLRVSEEATNILDSTSHAIIRNMLEFNHIDQMFDVLNDRLNYGIFLDPFTANLAMDKFLKANDYKSAARIASLLMLQEDLGRPLSKEFCVYAALQFCQNPQPFVQVEETIENPGQEGGKKKKPEEKKIRVRFLRNEYFDDHFDLVDSKHLVGKTLLMLGDQLKGTVSNTCKLLGFTFYQKYDAGLKFLDELSGNPDVYKEAIDLALKQLGEIPDKADDETLQKFSSALTALKATKSNMFEDIKTLLEDAVKTNESIDIKEQRELHESFNKLREARLKEELERMNRVRRLRDIENMSKEMELEEQKLWFFDKVDKIELQIDSKKVYYPKRWFGKLKKPRHEDVDYVPPEIRSDRN